jgi:hypothetical protein
VRDSATNEDHRGEAACNDGENKASYDGVPARPSKQAGEILVRQGGHKRALRARQGIIESIYIVRDSHDDKVLGCDRYGFDSPAL